MPRCVECDREAETGVIFCPDCGHEVAGSTPDPPTANGSTASDADGPDIPTDGPVLPGDESDAAGEDRRTGQTDGESDEETVPTMDVEGPSPFEAGPLSFAAQYPVRNSAEAVLYGGIAEVFGLLVPLFQLPTRGHGFRVAGAAARGQATPPEFDDLAEAFVDGLRVLAVLSIYVVVVGALALTLVIGDEILGTDLATQLSLVAGLAALYALPASLTANAATGRFGAAFSRDHAVAFLTSGPYAKAFVLWLVAIATTAIASLVAFMTVVGGFFVWAWGIYAVSALWGYYYRQAVARGVVPAPPDEPL